MSRIQTLDSPRMAKVERKATTRSEHVRELIEEGIATGRFPPGMRLDEVELAERFNVSRTPLREALFQLASAGIVEMQPRRGTVVAEVSPHRMVEMFEVMAELEAMCGRLAARRMLAPEHERLLAAHRACENARRRTIRTPITTRTNGSITRSTKGATTGSSRSKPPRCIGGCGPIGGCSSACGTACRRRCASTKGSCRPFSPATRISPRSACAITSSCRASASRT